MRYLLAVVLIVPCIAQGKPRYTKGKLYIAGNSQEAQVVLSKALNGKRTIVRITQNRAEAVMTLTFTETSGPYMGAWVPMGSSTIYVGGNQTLCTVTLVDRSGRVMFFARGNPKYVEKKLAKVFHN
jgi:hypothetical protein